MCCTINQVKNSITARVAVYMKLTLVSICRLCRLCRLYPCPYPCPCPCLCPCLSPYHSCPSRTSRQPSAIDASRKFLLLHPPGHGRSLECHQDLLGPLLRVSRRRHQQIDN